MMQEKGLPGAKFALYKNKNCAASDLVRELGPTDSNGKAESASFHIEQEIYYLKETQPPTGYPSQPDKVYEVTVKTGVTKGGIEYTVPNSNKIRVGVYKYELGSGKSKPLAGAEYTLYSNAACTNTVVKLGPTGSNGYASSVEFEYNDAYKGIYYMKETKAPVGYKLSTEVKKIDVSNAVKDDKIPYVTFYNAPYDITVEINKVDKDTKKPLEGATFAIFYDKDQKRMIEEGTTDAKGKVTFKFHPEQESYWLFETKEPNGYDNAIPDGKEIIVSDSKEGTVPIEYTIEDPIIDGGFKVRIKKTDAYGSSLGSGFTFDVCTQDLVTGEIVVWDTLTTNALGVTGTSATMPILDNVVYYVLETDVGNNRTYLYSVGTIKTFQPSNEGVIVEIPFENPDSHKTPILQLEKTDTSGKKLKGVKFRVYKDFECTDLLFETSETDENGLTDRIAVPGVSSPVTYYVKEIQYPEGDGWIEWKEPEIFCVGCAELWFIHFYIYK